MGCEHTNVVASCGGFFDEEDCKSEAESEMETYEKIYESLMAE